MMIQKQINKKITYAQDILQIAVLSMKKEYMILLINQAYNKPIILIQNTETGGYQEIKHKLEQEHLYS